MDIKANSDSIEEGMSIFNMQLTCEVTAGLLGLCKNVIAIPT